MNRLLFATSKQLLGMQLHKAPTSNTCRTNSNGRHYQRYRSNGRLSSWPFNASKDPNAKSSQNLFMNGSLCKTDTKFTAHPLITPAPPVAVPPKQQPISFRVRILTVKLSGQNSMNKYYNTTCTTKLSLCITIFSNTD